MFCVFFLLLQGICNFKLDYGQTVTIYIIVVVVCVKKDEEEEEEDREQQQHK